MLRPQLGQPGRTTSDPEQVRRRLATSSTVAATAALGLFVDEASLTAGDGTGAAGHEEAAVPLVPLDLRLDDRGWDDLVKPSPRPAPPMSARSLTAPLPSRTRPPPSPRNSRRPFAFPTPDPVDDEPEPRKRQETVTPLSPSKNESGSADTKAALARRSVIRWDFGDVASPTMPEAPEPVAGPSLLRPSKEAEGENHVEDDDELFKTPTPESVSQFAYVLPDGDGDEADPAALALEPDGSLESAAQPFEASDADEGTWAFQPPLPSSASAPSSPIVSRRPIPRPRTNPSPIAVPSFLPNDDGGEMSFDENDTLVWSTPSPTGLIGDDGHPSLPGLSGGFVRRRRGTGPSPPSPPESEDSPRTPLHLELAEEPRPVTRKGLRRSSQADWGSIDFPSLHDLSLSESSTDPPRPSSPVVVRPATRAPFRRHTVSSASRSGSRSRLRTPSPPPALPPLASTVGAVSMTKSASWRSALESPSSRDPRRPGAKTVRVGPIAGRVLFSDPNAPPLPPIPAHLINDKAVLPPTREKRAQSLVDAPRRPALPTSRSLYLPSPVSDRVVGGEKMDRSASESSLMSPHRDGSPGAAMASGSGPAFEALSPRRQFGRREEVRETGQWSRLNLDLAMVKPPARKREFDDEEVAQLKMLEGARASRRISRGWSMGSKGLGIAS